MAKPPNSITIRPKVNGKLFGGALTPEYRAWYYRTQCACRAAGGNDWPEFFAKAKEVEMRRQGLKPHNVVPFKANLADGRLMFDFAVQPQHHLNQTEEREA